ncbi:MAG: SCO family protein [Pseudomonadota bacterium]
MMRTKLAGWKEHFTGVIVLSLALTTLISLPFLPARSASKLGLDALDTLHAKWALVFAGYPGCTTQCPLTLANMAAAQRTIASDDLQLVFINTDRYGSSTQSTRYASLFHASFVAISTTDIPPSDLMRKLGIQTFDDVSNQPAHSGQVFLLKRAGTDWRIDHVYRQTPDASVLVDDLSKRMMMDQPLGAER